MKRSNKKKSTKPHDHREQSCLQGNTTTNYEWWTEMSNNKWATAAAIHTFYVEADVGDFNTNSCLTVYGINGA